MLTLSVFVSSPGDLDEERKAVRRVTTELENSHLLRGKVHFRVIAWDDPDAASPMELGVTPQDSVNRYAGRPSECDLTLVILWGRIGTRLPPHILRPDGSCYASGTVWELEDARSAGRPVWLYRRTSKPRIDIDDPGFEAKRKQYAAVKDFFDGLKASDGSLTSGVNSYTDPDDFARQLRQHLEALVNTRLQELAKEPVSRREGATPLPPGKPVPKPVLRLPQHAIVGREKLVEKVLADLQAGRRDFAFVYLPGVGKTAVAAELIRNEALVRRFPDGVLWAHLGQDPDINRQLAKWGKALGLSKADLADCNGLDELSEAVVQAIGERHLLLVVDDVWCTEAGERFMIGGPNCARVVTTRYRKVARELMPTVDAVLEVRKLSADEGFQLLAELAPHAAAAAPQILRKIIGRVDGLPIALVLIGKMLKRDGDDAQAAHAVLQALNDIARVFHEKKPLEYSEAHHFSLGEVVEASYSALGTAGPLNRDGVPGDPLRDALEALSVLRPDPAWFPTALARLLIGPPDAALKALADAGLIEMVRYEPGAPPAGDEVRYTMHRMIAEYIRTKLAPQRLQALNRAAADYYLAQLTELEEAYQEGDTASYSAMYRYEDPEWQDCQDNWLYYFAQTGYDAEANISFLRAWFDGFWWWSCFTAEGYDFCDELLNDWDYRLALSTSGAGSAPALDNDRIERLMHGLELLRRFKRAYPKETEDRSGGAWPDVIASLNELRHRTGLDREIARLASPHARHVRALTDIFLAEAERFGHHDVPAAEVLYREAVALFREANEDWNIAWSLYHLADMLCACGRHDESRPLALEARDFGLAGGDHEVVAVAHRVLGDIALAARDAQEALRNYQLAVEYAYRFQVEPKNPDPYTIQFYSDISRRVADHLLENYAAMPEQVQLIAGALRQAWLDCGAELGPLPEGLQLKDTTAENLRTQLFPPPLPLERLKAEEKSYLATVKGHLAAIAAREAARNAASPVSQ
jgi:hypothetical protein